MAEQRGCHPAEPEEPSTPVLLAVQSDSSKETDQIGESGITRAETENVILEKQCDMDFTDVTDTHVLKRFDSLQSATQAVADYEEYTISNFVVLEKKKLFGNEACPISSASKIYWNGPVVNNASIVEYTGVPYIIIGRKVLNCHLGKDLAISQKRRYVQKRQITQLIALCLQCFFAFVIYHHFYLLTKGCASLKERKSLKSYICVDAS
ncbi:uncharacterized protein LOC121001400 [Bufo bufo]|uniref:uncharacterized protein LOC120984615 n=1 Tax=Bufo bufo TaxID=8384 RepID=UPI001ABDD94D|nr:uncharacterized protein LOC120984615 [Bufo bufo]XP_040272111.1 uncharacterized protein LOC120988608 isoform X2 [Bufo bufo]XP_040272112.1 uncharacterized protein LOC120988608 isoform X2 [Bufo bufo]XP_040272114.1 uncharacterized protein LOC120988608 isoform X2 [Bufo bufo]XP_040288376.1 uncharacterized protein LOC121001400 [Bufo bufo]